MKITKVPVQKSDEECRADLDKALKHAREKGIPDWVTFLAMRSAAQNRLKNPTLKKFVVAYCEEHEQDQ